MSDLDEIREAAVLMRCRALDATPGPWSTSPKAAYGSVVSQHADGLLDNGALDFEVYGGYLIGESITTANREHIAGMHPAVALAVADWLNTAAADLWAHGPLHCADGCIECDDDLWAPHVRAALNLARTYLGRTS